MSDFPKKFLKVLPDEFKEAAEAANNEELDKKIVQCEQNLYDIAKAKAADEELLKLREQLKEAGASYSEGKKAQNACIQYAVWLKEQRAGG